VEHSHFFTTDGQFGSYDELGAQVDNGDYEIVKESMLAFPSHGAEFGSMPRSSSPTRSTATASSHLRWTFRRPAWTHVQQRTAGRYQLSIQHRSSGYPEDDPVGDGSQSQNVGPCPPFHRRVGRRSARPSFSLGWYLGERTCRVLCSTSVVASPSELARCHL
jgi:hypothetical protein